MGKVSNLTIPISDDENVDVPILDESYQLALYLASKLHLKSLEKSLLSMLSYPIVWTVESAIWKRDFGNNGQSGDASGSFESFDQITQALDNCFKASRKAVKTELFNIAKKYRDSSASSNHAIGEYKYILVDSSGNLDGGTAIPKDQWLIIVKMCSELSHPRDHQLAILSALVFPVVFATEGAIRKKYLHGSSTLPGEEMGFEELMDRDKLILGIARVHTLHCMDD